MLRHPQAVPYVEMATWTDIIDGGIDLVSTPPVRQEAGTYEVTYTCTDTDANSDSGTRAVHIIDYTTRPLILMASGSRIFHEIKTPYRDPGGSGTDTVDGPPSRLAHALARISMAVFPAVSGHGYFTGCGPRPEGVT